MKSFQNLKDGLIYQAVQITEETFDAPHPNSEHLVGCVYDPVSKRVEVSTVYGLQLAGIGDWIVLYDVTRQVYSGETFGQLFIEQK